MATQAGKLFAQRRLTALEVEAVDRWCEMLHTWDRVILDMGAHRAALGSGAAGRQPRRRLDAERLQRFRERFDAAQNAMLAAGRPALRDLNRLCRDEAAMQALPEARKGLAQLIAHWHLT